MRRMIRVTLVVLLFCAISQANPLPYTHFVVFGDSLSDTGNVYARTAPLPIHTIPAPPEYTWGRFTSGPGSNPSGSPFGGVWHEDLAKFLGLPVATPSVLGGTNYAFGDATTGSGFSNLGVTDNMYLQVSTYLSQNTPTSDALYILWGGSNDLLDAVSNPGTLGAVAHEAVHNLEYEIGMLAQAGAKHFLWADLPPLEDTPLVRSLGTGVQDAMGDATAQFRSEWLWAKDFYASQLNVDITGFDVYGVMNSILQSPSSFGFTNWTDPSQGQAVNPDDYLFWDDLHPTAKGHYWLGAMSYFTVLNSPSGAGTNQVPEPGTFVLLVVGLAFVLLLSRRQPRSSTYLCKDGSGRA